tara:strand:+ start:438 stop:1088 length:651 start_codon:yes stop_codon:yes gene_type:complete
MSIEYLFGLPVLKTKIDPTEYNKDVIVKDILENYEKDSTRNVWEKYDSINVKSRLHHSFNDPDPKFKRIDYSDLVPVYEQKIAQQLQTLQWKNDFSFEFTIENYTCIKENHYMREHAHPWTDFTAVHYVKFDPKQHFSTVYVNTHDYADYAKDLAVGSYNHLDTGTTAGSYMNSHYSLNTDEDDFVITPSFVKHSVPFHEKCSDHRITIALNIIIK